MVTLCPTCHALAHGMNLVGVDLTPEDVEQAVVEYMADYYAGQGYLWPSGEPIMDGGYPPRPWEPGEPANWEDALDEFYFAHTNPVEEIADMIDGITARYGRGRDD